MTPTGFLIRDGIRLAIHDAGGPGRPVLFQHGLCGDAHQTSEAFPPDPQLRRITLECRGHGASETGGVPAIATFTADVAALIEQVPHPTVVGGISMGAAIALRLAVIRPDLVRALILVRPAWGTQSAPANMAPMAEVGALLHNLPPDAARAAFESSATARRLVATAPDNLASLVGFFDRLPQGETARLLTAIAADGPGVSTPDLAALDLPVLICGTGEDAIHPLTLAQDLARMIPGAQMRTLPPKGRDKAAHLTALHGAISTFLKEL